MEGGGTTTLSVYDEAALCSSTFKSVSMREGGREGGKDRQQPYSSVYGKYTASL